MISKFKGASLLVLAAFTVPAVAQNNVPATTGQPMQQPGATAPQTGSQPRVTQQTGQAMGTFITQEDQNTWRASKIVGVNIYGSNNETIGDVNEVLIDRSGQVRGVVIGVGGFLGIGEKYVAVPFNQVEWMLTDTRASANQNQTGAAMNSDAAESDRDGRAAGRTSNETTGTVARAPMGASGSASRGYPDHGVLRMTKADLENAPNFNWPNSWTR